MHFKTRSFDLDTLRSAITSRQHPADVMALVRTYEAAVQQDQQEFVEAVKRIGGKVTQQWWLINASLVEIPHARLIDIRLLANTAFVEADQACSPQILAATNSNNHNADAMQALGHKGQGVTIGVVDSGQDENMAGVGRPHRLYYVNGDTANLTGGGIGGSRLLVNRMLGVMPADDITGHGTEVASICTGASIGIAGADDGHAPLAGIAGYAISDDAFGGTFYSTLTTAWQSMAGDAAAYTIKCANMSYTGPSDPRSAPNAAMDSAAINTDILYAVGAGNNGSATPPAGATACNGLAVGAVQKDAHIVASYSARGPVSGDPLRTYPDIAACSDLNIPTCNNETSLGGWGRGTSFASPMVAGAAAQLRGRFPGLTALQTKAVLLASSTDLTGANPGLGRNDYGVGFLRNDLAHACVASGNSGTGSVGMGAPHTVAFPVVAGHTYHGAIAWHRYNLQSLAWSDLNLEIAGSTSSTLLASTSQRNLYEAIRFTATHTETITLRTTASFIELGSSVQFSYAWCESPVPALAVPFDLGCAPFCGGLNTAGGQLSGLSQGGETAVAISTLGPASLTGIDVLVASAVASSSAYAYVLVYADNSSSIGSYLGASSFVVAPDPRFYRAEFSPPLSLPGGQFWISFYNPGTTIISDLTTGTQTSSFRAPSFSGQWTPAPPLRPAIRLNCLIPGSGSAPSMTCVTPPIIGQTMSIHLNDMAQSTVSVFGLGSSNSVSPLGPLPLPLDSIGATGCMLLVSTDISTSFHFADSFGHSSNSLFIPLDPLLIGYRFFAQGFALAPGANSLGWTTSNGMSLWIGGY